MLRSAVLGDLMAAASVTWGVERQASVVAEECAELIKAIAKARRQGLRLTDWVLQEMVDVQIMLWQMDPICQLAYGETMNQRPVNTHDLINDPMEILPALAKVIEILPGLIMNEAKFKPPLEHVSGRVATAQYEIWKLENSFLALDKIPGGEGLMQKSIDCELARKAQHLHSRLDRHGVKL